MMVSPRWKKVLADLVSNKVRTLLVVVSIGIGVFAVGAVSGMYLLLLSELDAAYQAVNPHSAILYTLPFDEDLLLTVRQVEGVGEAEGRTSVAVKLVKNPQEKISLNINGIASISAVAIDKIKPVTPGSDRKLGKNEILLERSISQVLQVKPGDKLLVELDNERQRELTVAGIVHDVSTFPYILSRQLYGYANLDTIERLGGTRKFTQLYLTVAEEKHSEPHVRDVANKVAEKIKKGGQEVFFTFVFKPGEHPASFLIQALLGLLGGMGMLAVFLSGFLVINTIMALLSQHTRQIGMMKAIGARTDQIITMYLFMVVCFGILALILFVPLAGLLAYAGSQYFAKLINFDLPGFRIAPLAVILQVIVAIGIPVATALLPVARGARLTIREAISSYGISSAPKKLKKVEQRPWFHPELTAALISRPLLISLRNTFRRKARLILTLSTLSLGGAIFIAVFNVQAALNKEIDRTLGYFLSDLNLSLNRSYRIQSIASIAKKVPGVEHIEGWGFSTAQLMSPDGFSSTEILIISPPTDSDLIDPTMISGRWLMPEDQQAIVIGNHLIRKRPDLKEGDKVILKIEGKESQWTIVGKFKMAGNVDPPLTYTNGEPISRLRNEINQTSEYRIITEKHDEHTQAQVAEALQKALQDAGIGVSNIQTGSQAMREQSEGTNIIILLLLVMAILIAIVGGLGLMGTMSMNVLERSREIGVMRAIGASDFSIVKLVIVEGMLIGMISWAFGTLLAVPISKLLGDAVGYSLLTTSMTLAFSLKGFIIWLVVVIILSAVASLLPARNASRLTIREVLAYE